jgi:hypothetical protein
MHKKQHIKIPSKLVYNEERTEIPVTIGKRNFVLTELQASGASKWRKRNMSSLKVKGDKVVSIGSAITDSEIYLLSLCFYHCDGDEQTTPLDKDGNPDSKKLASVDTISDLPERIVSDLFEHAKIINNLSEFKKDEDDNEGEDEENPTNS